MADGPRFTIRGTEGSCHESCALISPNCQHKLEFLGGTLASDFQWRPVRGGLCRNEEFEKALAEIQHDTHHN